MKTDTLRTTKALAVLLVAVCLAGGMKPAVAEGAGLVANTDVSVITRSVKLEITGISEDVAGGQDEVRALTLMVEATGEGELSYSWTRTIDGTSDPSFSREGSTCALDDVQAATRYAYTVEVIDGTGAAVSAEVQVYVTAASDEFVNERITYPLLGVTVEANHHKDARFVVSIQPVGTDAFLRLLNAVDGVSLRPPAYSIRVEGQPDDQPAFVGSVRVSFPSPGQPAVFRAWAAESESEAVEVLLLGETGGSQRLTGTEAGGRVTFEADAMGDFAALAQETKEPSPLPQEPSPLPQETPTAATADNGGAPFVRALGSTGDGTWRGVSALAVLACAAGAAAGLSLAYRALRRRRTGR